MPGRKLEEIQEQTEHEDKVAHEVRRTGINPRASGVTNDLRYPAITPSAALA